MFTLPDRKSGCDMSFKWNSILVSTPDISNSFNARFDRVTASRKLLEFEWHISFAIRESNAMLVSYPEYANPSVLIPGHSGGVYVVIFPVEGFTCPEPEIVSQLILFCIAYPRTIVGLSASSPNSVKEAPPANLI